MNIKMVLFNSLLITTIATAQSTLLVNSSTNDDIRINTADNYSLMTRTAVFRFEHTSASEMARLLNSSLSKYGNVIINEEINSLIITEEQDKLQNILDVCQELDTEELADYHFVYNEQIPMQNNRATEIASLVTDYLSPDGRIQADDNFNVLIVSDNQYAIKRIREKVEELDQPQRQIVIDIEILEIERSGLAENGIDWDAALSQSWIAASGGRNSLYSTPASLIGSDNGLTTENFQIGGGVNINDIRNIISIMQSEGTASVLSTPKVITLSGREASVWYGKDITYPYTTIGNTPPSITTDQNGVSFSHTSGSSSTSLHGGDNDLRVSTNNGGSYQIKTERTAGLELNITPFAGESDIIKIDLECKLTNIIGWTDAGFPIVSGQEIDNEILGFRDQTILIGGMRRTKVVEVTKRIPGLGHILPFLFSRTKNEEVETEIAIFITPRLFDISSQDETYLEFRNSELD